MITSHMTLVHPVLPGLSRGWRLFPVIHEEVGHGLRAASKAYRTHFPEFDRQWDPDLAVGVLRSFGWNTPFAWGFCGSLHAST